MVDLTQDPAALATVLHLLSQSDGVKNGEAQLKPFLKQTGCVPSLITQLKSNPNDECRHHAALLLKKRANPLLKNFNPQQVQELKAQFLQLMTAEPNKTVAVALAGVVASVSKTILAKEGNWPELFALLMQLAQDPAETRRTLNFSLLEQLAENVATHLKPHTPTLAQMFVSGCQDASTMVSQAAMAATGRYIKEICDDPAVMQLQCVIMPMLQVMQGCLERGDEDLVVEAMDVLGEMVSMEQPLINDHVEQITPFMVSVLGNENLDNAVRSAAGQMLISLVENRPKLVAKKNMVTPVLTALVEMISKSNKESAGSLYCFARHDDKKDNEDDDDYDPDEEEETDIDRLVQTVVDSMAISIPSKHFVQPALALAAQGMASADPNMRKAGVALLGVIAEGCCDPLKQCLGDIMPRLLALYQDPEYYVREVASFALGQFAEHCQPDILHYHSTVLPVVFHALEDVQETVQSTSCYVLEMFLENLSRETLRPFLQPLLTRLMTKLTTVKTRISQEMALTAISSVAVAAEIEFLPFSEAIVSSLAPMLMNTEPANFGVRGRSLECLGHVAVAIGSDHFARYFEGGMQSAIQALELEDDDLKEHSYVFFANTSRVMGPLFQPYLDRLVPLLLDVVMESELVAYEDEDEEDNNDDDEEQPSNVFINGRDGFVNNKKAALTALGSMAEHTKELFAPYLQKTLEAATVEELSGAVHSYHDVVRAEAYEVLGFLVGVACYHEKVPQKPPKLTVLPLPGATTMVLKTCMKYLIDALETDHSKTAVSYACEAVNTVISRVGCAALSVRLDPVDPAKNVAGPMVIEAVTDALMKIFQEKSPCQKVAENDEDEDDGDHDNVLMDSAADLVCTLAKTVGEQLVPFFDQLQKPLQKFMKPTRVYTDRSMVIGIYGEVLLELGPQALKYVEPLMPMIKTGLADQMEAVRRNAAYCLGVLVRVAGKALSPHFMAILQSLHPLCTRPAEQMGADKGGADVDNALSAVAHMIKTDPAVMAAVIPQVLPVMLAALPLRSDQTEGPNVYGCVVELLLGGDATAQQQLPEVLRVFGDVLAPDSVSEDEAKERVTLCLRQLAGNPQTQGTLAAALERVTSPVARAAIESAVIAKA